MSKLALAATLEDDATFPAFDPIGTLVREPPLVVDLNTPLVEVRRLLIHYRVPGVIVSDASDRLQGILTRTDVLRGEVDGGATAGDAMSAYVLALPASASVANAAALIGFESVGMVIVTDGRGALLGLVSAVDVVRHFAITAGALHL